MIRSISRRPGHFVLCGAAMVLAACSTSKQDAGTGDSSAMSTSTTTSTSTMSSSNKDSSAQQQSADPGHFSDANILAKEMAGDSAEVAIAGLAKTKATSAAVKSYAALLVSDHSKGLASVKALATKSSISPQTPAGDTTAQSTSHTMQRLQGLARGPAFDTAFVNHEIEDHQQDLQDAHAMSGAAQNAQVKALVDKSIPELQKHLDRAKSIAGSTKS